MQPGDRLAGRYDLREPLGHGGMGEVFRAQDTSLDREVAVKVLPKHLLGDPGAVERFRREARTAASLAHPNIVTVHDVVEDDGVHAIVMELVDGPTLADIIRDTGSLPWREALTIGAAVADGLEAAHASGLVHRDVKPSNVLIARGDRVKITDFGIARAMEASRTMTGTVYGSAPYLAPEQALGEDTGPATDVYSLGCLLYELLTGRPPYVAEDAVGVVYQHLHADPVPPSERRRDLPPHVDAVVGRALRREPTDRYASAAEFAAVLREAERGVLPPAATVPVAPPATPDATQALPPVRSAPQPAAERPVAATRVRTVRRRSPAAPILVIGGLILGALLLAGLLADEPSPAPGGEPTAPATTDAPTESPTTGAPTETASPTTAAPSPSPTAAPTTAPPSPTPTQPTFDEAVADLRAAIAQARQAGELSEQAEETLDEALTKVVSAHDEGKQEEARRELEKLREELSRSVEQGQATQAAVERLEPRIDQLDAAIGRG